MSSSILHLLANYYKSVIESERLYNEYKYVQLSQNKDETKKEPVKQPLNEKDNLDTPNPNDLVALQLQKQVNKLTSQIQTLTKQNDKLKETNKSQRMASEEKINTLQAIVQGLQETISTQNNINNNSNNTNNTRVHTVNSNTGIKTPVKSNMEPNENSHTTTNSHNNNTHKSKFHLLSPLGKNISSRSRSSNHTIFDDSSCESDEYDDKHFLNSSNKSSSKEIDSFILSLKKYDESRVIGKLEETLNSKGTNNNKNNNNDSDMLNQIKIKNKKNEPNISPTKLSVKRTSTDHKNKNKKIITQNTLLSSQIKKLSDKDIPNLKTDDSASSKKRKLSGKKIQVTSDDEQLLHLESQ